MNINNLLYIIYILLFLPSFCFMIGSQFVPVYIPAALCLFFILAIFYHKQLISNALYFYKKTPFKYLVIFFIWSIITIIFSIVKGKFFIGGFITSTLGGLICSVMIPCLLTLFFINNKYISIKTFIKFLYLFIWFVFLLGIIDFIIFYFDIPVLKEIITIFSNRRLLVNNVDEIVGVFANNFPRARSIFDEPSYLGYFIFVVSPIVYEWTLNEFRMFQNKYLNLLIKKTIIPFMWTSLILTQSPIFLIFNIAFSSFYFLIIRKGYKRIVKHFVPISIFLTFTVAIAIPFISKIDFSTTYLNRIILVVQNIKSFEDFIMVEPSLGTRIIIMFNTIIMGLNNLFFGVGYGNMSYLIADQLSKSLLPLTGELKSFVLIQSTAPASTIFIKIFSETGIIGTTLFYYFIHRMYKKLNMKKKQKTDIKNYKIVNGLQLFIVTYFFSSFYDSNLNQPYIFILIGFTLIIIYKYKKI